jgi:hypothetical protein
MDIERIEAEAQVNLAPETTAPETTAPTENDAGTGCAEPRLPSMVVEHDPATLDDQPGNLKIIKHHQLKGLAPYPWVSRNEEISWAMKYFEQIDMAMKGNGDVAH